MIKASGKVVILLIVLGVSLAGCKTQMEKTTLRDIPRSDRVVLMVLNFNNGTLKPRAEEFKPWELGLASMVMTDLESIGLFNILSYARLKDILKQHAFQMSGMVDEKEAVQMGKIAAARYVLSGSFMEMDGRLRIESQVFSVEKGIQTGAAHVMGPTQSFFELQKELVLKMTDWLGAMLTQPEKQALESNVETRSVQASLNNYAGEMAVMKAEELKAQGQEEMARHLIENARERFEKALEVDDHYERARRNLAALALAIPMTL